LYLLIGSQAFGGECPNATAWLNLVGDDLTVHRNVQPSDLQISVNGHLVKIASFSLDSRARRVIMIVDTSGSMEASPQRSGWGTSLPAAGFAVDSIPDHASVILLTFADKTTEESPGFEDRLQVRQRILDLRLRQPKGTTALYGAIDDALSLFGEPQFGDTIFLITDGADTRSKLHLAKLRERVIAHRVRIFFFPVQRAGHVASTEMEMASLIDQLADLTGGYTVRIPWSQNEADVRTWMAKSVSRLTDQVGSLYSADLDIGGRAGQREQIKIGLSNSATEKNATVVYPHQIQTCAQAP
jgi:hypothetical protein